METAFLADPAYANLADRLADRFQGVSVQQTTGPITCERLVVITSGHGVGAFTSALTRVQSNRQLVLGVGVPPSTLAWALPDASHIHVSDESPLHLWSQVEGALSETPAPFVQTVPPPVFVSHARIDEPALYPVLDTLRERFALDLFVCADSIPVGADWHRSIHDELQRREVLLAIVSQAYLASTFCAFEAGLALGQSKSLRMVSLDGTAPPSHLQHIQSQDVQRLMQRKPWLRETEALLECILIALNPTGDRS